MQSMQKGDEERKRRGDQGQDHQQVGGRGPNFQEQYKGRG